MLYIWASHAISTLYKAHVEYCYLDIIMYMKARKVYYPRGNEREGGEMDRVTRDNGCLVVIVGALKPKNVPECHGGLYV